MRPDESGRGTLKRTLQQPEVHQDLCLHRDWFSVQRAGLEAPLADGLDGLFIQAQTQAVNHLDAVAPHQTIGADNNRQSYFAGVLGLAGLFGVFRLDLVNRDRSGNAAADPENAAALNNAALLAADAANDGFARLALLEEAKSLPWSSVWDEYCRRSNTPLDSAFIASVKAYERGVLAKRS